MADSLSSSIQLLLGLPDEWAHWCVGVVGLPGCRWWVLGSFGDVQFAAPMLINHFATRHCEPKKKELSHTLTHTRTPIHATEQGNGWWIGGARGCRLQPSVTWPCSVFFSAAFAHFTPEMKKLS